MGYLLELAQSATDTTKAEESEIRVWLDQIEERDPAIREHVLRQCRSDPGALAYFMRHIRGEFLH